MAKEVGVFALPSVVFFRVDSDPTIFAGDLKNEESILEWVLIQKDPSNEAIQAELPDVAIFRQILAIFGKK